MTMDKKLIDAILGGGEWSEHHVGGVKVHAFMACPGEPPVKVKRNVTLAEPDPNAPRKEWKHISKIVIGK